MHGPSKNDYKLTDRIYEASSLMGIDLLDHIVIGDVTYTSILKRGNGTKNEFI